MFDTAPLIEMSRAAAGVDVRGEPDDALLEAAVALQQTINLAQAAQAHVLAELDARGVCDRDHGLQTTSWVTRETGCARGPVRSRMIVGRSLRNHFDQVDDAIVDGRLGFDHAKTLCDSANPRVVDLLAGAQDQIIALAETSSFDSWKRDVIALAEHADADGPEPDPYEGNELVLSKTIDRTTVVQGSLDAANALILRTALDAKTDELFKRFTRDHNQSPDLEIPGRRVLRALALIELVREATGAEPGSGSAPRAEVTLVVHDHETCDPDGTPLPQAATDVWGCDPDIWAVVVNTMGIPIDVGHTQRLATLAQRRAIATRDGGCTFPGCDAPITWCDHHHVIAWHQGGPTDLANLVALCRHHHGVTHRNGWTLTLDDEQVPHWTTPSGDHLTGQRHHRQGHHRRCARGDPDPDSDPDGTGTSSRSEPELGHRPDPVDSR